MSSHSLQRLTNRNSGKHHQSKHHHHHHHHHSNKENQSRIKSSELFTSVNDGASKKDSRASIMESQNNSKQDHPISKKSIHKMRTEKSKVIGSKHESVHMKSPDIDDQKKRYSHELLVRTIGFFKKESQHYNDKSKNETSIVVTNQSQKPKTNRKEKTYKSKPTKKVDSLCKMQKPSRKNETIDETPTILKMGQQPSKNNHLYIMDEKQLIELFKSFLHSINAETVPQVVRTRTDNYTNQMIVEDREMLEYLNDELNELLANINTIQNSYHDIVRSLVSIQKNHRRRRSKQQLLPETNSQLEEQQQQLKKPSSQPQKKIKDETTSTATDTPIQKTTSYAKLEQFMNPNTREEAFVQLFNRVERLKSKMKDFREMFTIDGTLIIEKYRYKINFRQYSIWRTEIREISKIVEAILQEYNREVLELFRISQMSSMSNINE